ncbi:hypothetical protein DOM21_16075 [Bacteriovorax stolpii]|uniref:YkgJ family cysteine cluster protein n=1 Tax=Bacteriovorax stolpii TaxID=960 RepID=UPI00115BE45B|nr:YkgJ family cysteine cluster protein [Bacteriovorax stolpii]QDK42941.1 hypothetical protein DOM21_16075 [Bacteriovorax stolpii]
MNIPAIAKNTFELLRNQPEFMNITESVVEHLNKIKSKLEKARFVHNVVDECNKEVFAHPLLKEFVPCKAGCSGCCHTQVSVTEDEAELLLHNIDEGVVIDYNRLSLQSEAGNEAADFYKLSYKDRACVFLDENGACKVYKDRPSVCRTNAVVGEASQCDTSSQAQGPLRLVKTPKADMAIVAAFAVAESGTLPVMLSKVLKERNASEDIGFFKTIFDRFTGRKPVPKDTRL